MEIHSLFHLTPGGALRLLHGFLPRIVFYVGVDGPSAIFSRDISKVDCKLKQKGHRKIYRLKVALGESRGRVLKNNVQDI